jgi:hypothetical protein
LPLPWQDQLSLRAYSVGSLPVFCARPGALGYLINPAVGGMTYNLLHHKAIAIGVTVIGFAMDLVLQQDSSYMRIPALTGYWEVDEVSDNLSIRI